MLTTLVYNFGRRFWPSARGLRGFTKISSLTFRLRVCHVIPSYLYTEFSSERLGKPFPRYTSFKVEIKFKLIQPNLRILFRAGQIFASRFQQLRESKFLGLEPYLLAKLRQKGNRISLHVTQKLILGFDSFSFIFLFYPLIRRKVFPLPYGFVDESKSWLKSSKKW